MEVAANDTLLAEPTRAELRETTLNYHPFSAPSSSSSTPRSPEPLLGPSSEHDTEAAVNSGSEKKFFTRLRDRIWYSTSSNEHRVTYNTKVSSNIRAVSDYQPGYGRLAAFEACDPSFLICRKFSWLHSRLLLHLQDELQEMERELERLDKNEHQRGDGLMLRASREDRKRPNAQRPKLLLKIHEKLKEYDELMFRTREVQNLKRPSERNQGSVYQEMTVDASAIDRVEAQWVTRSDDLAALAKDTDQNWFNVALEDALNWLSRPMLLYLFRSKEQNVKTGSIKYLNLVHPARFDGLLKGLLTLIGALLLLIPVVILFEIQPTDPSEVKSQSWRQLLVVFIFTFTFSACCSIFTNAKKQEIFTATAAYSAVLVVFLGNTSQALTCSGDSS